MGRELIVSVVPPKLPLLSTTTSFRPLTRAERRVLRAAPRQPPALKTEPLSKQFLSFGFLDHWFFSSSLIVYWRDFYTQLL